MNQKIRPRPPLSPSIRIHGIDRDLYDAVDAESQRKAGHEWKRTVNEVTYFGPGKHEINNELIAIQFFPTKLATYERFQGEETSVDDNVWKEGKLGNVSVTMFKPDDS